MLDPRLETAAYEGVAVDFLFDGDGPTFGDLFLICGYDNPNFPPPGLYDFGALADLQFSQVDDYFGVRSLTDDGSDIVIWLFPLMDGQEVYHHPGPFTGLRLAYGVLRNPVRHVTYFLKVVQSFAENLKREPVDRQRGISLGYPPKLELVERDIGQIVAYWREQGIEPGSSAALEIDY